MSKRNRSAVQIAAILAIALAAFWAGIGQTPAQQPSDITGELFEVLFSSGAMSINDIDRPKQLVTGENPNVSSANDETIWTPGGILDRLSTLTSIEIVSSSLNDTVAGTGCQVFLLNGLAADGTELSQLIPMNGTIAVVVPIQLLAIQPSGCNQAGILEGNDGDISIQDAGGGILRGFVGKDPGGLPYGNSRTADLTVPIGKVFVLTNLGFNTKEDFRVLVCQRIPPSFFEAHVLRVSPFEIIGQASVEIDPICFPEGSTIEIRGQSTSGIGKITVAFGGWFVNQGGKCPQS